MNKSFDGIYKNKNILITGHTGFKGSWLTTWLCELNANITGYSLAPPTEPNLFGILNLEKKINSLSGDIRDEDHLYKAFMDARPEIVFHLASQSLVRNSYSQPKLTYETNVMGALNLLECIRKTKSVRSVVIVTSDKCYENKETAKPYKENDPLGGYDPYSSSKACVEILVSSYRNSFFNKTDYNVTHNVGLASARSGNVIGGGDWAIDRLIPDCIKALVKNQQIVLRNPEAVRPWQYVLEPLSGYLRLGELLYKSPDKYSGSYNFGPDSSDSKRVIDVVEKIINLWGNGEYKFMNENTLHEAISLTLDSSKSRQNLNWQTVYDSNEAIENTINWYRQYYPEENKSIVEYTVKEIKKFINKIK